MKRNPDAVTTGELGEQYRQYIWDVTVRSTHWCTALSVFALSLSGIYIGDPYIVAPGEAQGRFVMGTAKAIHFYSGMILCISVSVRLLWMFVGPRRATWREFIPTDRERLVGIFTTLAFYLFIRHAPPRSPGHNPLAGMTYVLVFLLYIFMIVSGLAMAGLSAHVESPLRWLGPVVGLFGGAQTTRWLHHLGMWLLLGFVAHHVFSAFLISVVKQSGTVESIFSGYKWVKPKEAQREAARWRRGG